MKFTVEDTPLSVSGDKIPGTIERAIRVLEELPDGKLLLGISLAARVGVGPGTWMAYCNHPALRPYKVKQYYEGTNKNLYGNLATIKAYKEHAHE